MPAGSRSRASGCDPGRGGQRRFDLQRVFEPEQPERVRYDRWAVAHREPAAGQAGVCSGDMGGLRWHRRLFDRSHVKRIGSHVALPVSIEEPDPGTSALQRGTLPDPSQPSRPRPAAPTSTRGSSRPPGPTYTDPGAPRSVSTTSCSLGTERGASSRVDWSSGPSGRPRADSRSAVAVRSHSAWTAILQ
jgi:hypothetical protein